MGGVIKMLPLVAAPPPPPVNPPSPPPNNPPSPPPVNPPSPPAPSPPYPPPSPPSPPTSSGVEANETDDYLLEIILSSVFGVIALVGGVYYYMKRSKNTAFLRSSNVKHLM